MDSPSSSLTASQQLKNKSLAASVCICSFNGAARIGDVLLALAAQTLERSAWEVLVIDNASTDGTGEIAARLIKEKLGGCGRVVREEKPGLSFARARAAREAGGQIICFLDDDNIPAPGFAAAAVQAFAERPQAGIIGGKVLPVWSTPPTALALAVQDFALAICDKGDVSFMHSYNTGPVGAGICLRAEILRGIYQDEKTAADVPGRTGNGFGGGEDLAMAILAWKMGFECWYVPSLVLCHLLPPRRMEKDYLLKLYRGIGAGQASVRRIYDWKAKTPLALLIAAKDLGRYVAGRVWGPLPALREEHRQAAADVHAVNLQLLLGRAKETLRFRK